MGAWGVGTFENDDALDWLGDLTATADLAVLAETLDAIVSSTGYLDAPACSAALAAAEVVAALRGQAGGDAPEEIAAFILGKPQPDAALVSAARSAVARIAQNSELLELWTEGDDLASWQASLADLTRRLA
jgi:hypothetical protein